MTSSKANTSLSIRRPSAQKVQNERRDRILSSVSLSFALISASLVLLIAGFLIVEIWPLLTRVGLLSFFIGEGWQPSVGSYTLMPMLLGTLLTSAIAVCLAIPLGIFSAVFCQYGRVRWCSTLYRRLLELLAGIPSVVYGFWGLVVLVPLIGKLHPPGQSLLAGSLILTLMILPTMALLVQSSLAELPLGYTQGSAALGLSRWTELWQVLLPAARSGILAAIVLSCGRALGETMALLMVCGNVVQVPAGVFSPVRTLTANIALEMAYATGDHRGALFVSGTVLLAAVAALVLLAEKLRQGVHHA